MAKILVLLLFALPVSLPAEPFPEIDVEQLFAVKKALIRELMQLTEQESAVFWSLYDDYEKNEINIFKKREAHIREYMQEHKNMSDDKAK